MPREFSPEDDPHDPSYQVFSQHYTLQNEVGRGGWGIVKRAIRLDTQDEVAVKIIPRNALCSKSLDREILTMRVASEHVSIIHVHDVCFSAKFGYIITDLAQSNLSTYLAKNGSLSETQTADIIYQVLLGVQHLHELGICHRDLKLDNILLCGDNTDNVKISDFGLSRFFNSQSIMNTQCGTPEFVEILYRNAYDKACDLWSVGVMVFVLLTKTFPFWSKAVTAQYRKIITGIYKWPTHQPISTQAKNFVARLLETDPVLRMTATEALEHPWLRIVESGRLKTSMSIHDTTTSLSSVVKQGIVAAS